MVDSHQLAHNLPLEVENESRTTNVHNAGFKPRNKNVVELQMSIRALVSERREIQSRLCGNKGRSRNSGHIGIDTGTTKRDATSIQDKFMDEDEGTNTVSVKKSCAPAKSQQQQGSHSVVPGSLEVPPDAFPVEKRPKLTLDDSSIKRNRNLFGSLLGHLKKAKTRLDSEKTTRTAELQQLAEQQVSQKLALERKNLAELRRRDFQERQRRDLARMRDLQKELHNKEMQILSLNLQNHFNLMKNFIRTDTLPMIFWIPAVHNTETERLLSVTCHQIEDKVESLMDKFMEEISPSDIAMDSLRTWGSPSHETKATGTMNQDQSVRRQGASSTNAILTVHPDLINDSDEEEMDYGASHEAPEISPLLSSIDPPVASTTVPTDSVNCGEVEHKSDTPMESTLDTTLQDPRCDLIHCTPVCEPKENQDSPRS